MDGRADEALVEAARTGDTAAFGILVARHQTFVVAAAQRVVRNRTTAEDLAQEAFFRAWRRLEAFRGDAQFRTWVYRIVTNLALNHVTRSREQPVDELPTVTYADSTSEQVVDSGLEIAWRKAVDGLAPEIRQPYQLREFDGLAYEDIAKQLKVPLNTIRTRIYRARKAIKEAMKEWR